MKRGFGSFWPTANCGLAIAGLLLGAQKPDAPTPPQSTSSEHPPISQPAAPAPFTRQIEMPPPPPVDGDFNLSTQVQLVLLDVSVKQIGGGFASGLTLDNFKVFENNKQQAVSVFSSSAAPVTLGLVIDSSGSVRRKRSEVVTAALTFAQATKPQDQVFVVTFNDNVEMALPAATSFTDDPGLLRQALLHITCQGRTSLHDGLRVAMHHLDAGTRDRKTLVLISDGKDNASEATYDEIVARARESLATIYTIGIFDPEDKDKNPGFLRSIARITGGDAFFPSKAGSLVESCRKISEDIRNRYTIGYTPQDTALDGKIRNIRVEARSPELGKLQVRTRTQYIAAATPSRGVKAKRAR